MPRRLLRRESLVVWAGDSICTNFVNLVVVSFVANELGVQYRLPNNARRRIWWWAVQKSRVQAKAFSISIVSPLTKPLTRAVRRLSYKMIKDNKNERCILGTLGLSRYSST